MDTLQTPWDSYSCCLRRCLSKRDRLVDERVETTMRDEPIRETYVRVHFGRRKDATGS